MQITYFIGNGFDINLGLKTTYQDFYEYIFITKPDEIKDNVIYRAIKDKIKDWSDFEVALGLMTKESVFFEKIFYASLTEFRKDFKKYLILQLGEIADEDELIMDNFCTSFLDELTTNQLNKALNRLNKNMRQEEKKTFTFDTLTFNYTPTIDNYIKKFKGSMSIKDMSRYFEKHEPSLSLSLQDKFEINHPIHLHDTLENGMFLGVDNEEQINVDRLSIDLKDQLIKPLSTSLHNDIMKENALSIIKRTDLFIIFGCSFGETDKSWYSEVVSRLNFNNNVFCIIHVFNPNVDIYEDFYEKEARYKEYKQTFVNHYDPNLDSISKDNIFRSIFIIENTVTLFNRTTKDTVYA